MDGGGRGADHQVAEVFLFLLLVTVMLNSKKIEDLGLVKGACKGIERAGFTVIASNILVIWASPFFILSQRFGLGLGLGLQGIPVSLRFC